MDWRDELARKLDESPSFMINAKTVVTIATNPPKSLIELKLRIFNDTSCLVLITAVYLKAFALLSM